jgi:hypothetical protein
MAALQVAMIGHLPCTALGARIFTHPTIAEGLVFLLSGTPASPPPVT